MQKPYIPENPERREFFSQAGLGSVLLAAGAAASCSTSTAGSMFYPVRQFGAAGNGTARDTAAIQQAVDAAHAAGGGIVYCSPGIYLSGTIFLKSRVTFYLEAGAVLLGSTDLADFPDIPARYPSYTDNYVNKALLYAEDVEDISITGRGTIDGQGAVYHARTQEYLVRPYLIRMVLSRNILVEGITIKDSPMWVQHYLACEYVTLRKQRVISQVSHNNDMIDIDCCSNVHISDCYGKTGDDCITLKSTAGRICENITVTNCVLSTITNAIKTGTESNGGFRNITITNCTINCIREPTHYSQRTDAGSGITLGLVDGGIHEDIVISNITMRGIQVPLFLRLGNRARPFSAKSPNPGMGSFRNVILSNIIATATSPIGCSITGLPGHPIRDITLENIRLFMPGGGTRENAGRQVGENPDYYPKANMFGTLPACGIYTRHVDGLHMRNIEIHAAEADARAALVFDDVQNLRVDGFRAVNPGTVDTVVRCHQVRRARFSDCRTDNNAGQLFHLHQRCEHIDLIGNDFSGCREGVVTDGTAPAGTVYSTANRG